jgi:hypothetical protein
MQSCVRVQWICLKTESIHNHENSDKETTLIVVKDDDSISREMSKNLHYSRLKRKCLSGLDSIVPF